MRGSRRHSLINRILHPHSVRPSNEDDNPNSATNQNLLSTEPTTHTGGDRASPSSSIQSLTTTDEPRSRQNTTTNQLITNLLIPTFPASKSSHSLFAKLTDAKKSLFGRTNTPDPFFSSADENKALLSYILTESDPQLDIIQEFERTGAQLNAITDEGNTAIHLLARADIHSTQCITIVDYLIKRGCDPNRQNDYGWTAAHYALASRNTDLAVYLLKVMIDVNLPTFDAHNGYPSHTQLLHIAARQNDSVLIRLLIKAYKARVNVFDEDGCTPLHICCYEDNVDALKALLENDADFQKGTRLNPHETPVSICVRYQHDSCLQAIFDLTSNFNWKRYFSQLPRSPLLCDFPSIYAIELLVEHSLDIDACDERGNTFLHYLVNKKDLDYEKYIEILIQTSADFNRQNRLGRTPFLEALEQKNFQLIAVFLRHIELTNINIVDSLSNTALHYCKYINEIGIYETVLQSNPSSLNAQNRDGQTPLHEAILCDNYAFARFLLQRGADLTLTNKDGNTPLHIAARDDNTKMCKLLMKYQQLDLIAVNKMGKTPLHLACANEKPNVAAILINKLKIEQLNIVDVQGRTPLHECAENLNGSLARYLIRHGADENVNDFRQNNVLHLTTEKGNLELVRTLIKSSNIDINQLNADSQSPLALAILYNHDDVSKYLLSHDNISIQSTDLKMAMQMNNYEMVKLLIEKDRNCLRVRSSTHGDMIIHTYMRKNFNNLVCLETLLSFISDNELLTYLSECSLAYGDNLLHIAAREDTPNALTCFLNLSRVKFWFWANMMLTKNNEHKTPMELANEFKHYAIIKLINSKWKESYEYLSHSLRDGHCGVSSTGVQQAKRKCFNCNQTGLIEVTPGQTIRPCSKCNVCLYKSLDNSMQIFLALLFSDESSTIALDIMDSLIVINEVQKAVHLYLDHIEPWEEYDKSDLSESQNLLNQLVYATDNRKKRSKSSKHTASVTPLVQMDSGSSIPIGNNPNSNSAASSTSNVPGATKNPPLIAPYRPFAATKYRNVDKSYRPITPLEALYYHERLDLVTHPLIKGLIKWKWDNYAAKRFYLSLSLELIFLILWTCSSLIVPFPVRYVYRFPQDIWRCVLWGVCVLLLLWQIISELYDMSYARKRYEDYLIWETERTQNRLNLISRNKYKPNTNPTTTNISLGKSESLIKTDNPMRGDAEHFSTDETTNNPTNIPGIRSHHSQHHPLPATIPTNVRGKLTESQPTQQQPIDAPMNSTEMINGSKKISTSNNTTTNVSFSPEANRSVSSSRFVRFYQRINNRIKSRLRSYYMYYTLNSLFDWLVYILCLVTVITHFIDVGSHTVIRARIHMYIASITVICIWFRFMVFFRTISISAKTLRAKLVEIKLGELVIMVRMMFDDIIRFLIVFIFLLAPYAFVFFSVFGGRQILHSDYEQTPDLCEKALLYCPITEIPTPYDGTPESLQSSSRYIFNGTSSVIGDLCYNATESCRILEPDGFESFYSLLFSIFRIALVDDIPIGSFTLIDRYFAAFVCATYLLFTAILSINIFIGLISNALQTEAFSTVEARFLLERIEVILNYEWRLSTRKRLQLQEIIHRQCAPLQLDWKDINFDAFGQTREEQQTKAFAKFRQTIDKHNVQFDTFRIQVQQKLNDIDSTLNKLQTNTTTSTTTTPKPPQPPEIVVEKSTLDIPASTESTTHILEELGRLRELLEETVAGHAEQATATTTTPRVRHSSTTSTGTGRQSGTNLSSRHHHHQHQQQHPEASSATADGQQATQLQVFSHNINERVTDLQLAVNRLHQDVTAIRQVLERMSPLSTSLILGRTTTGRK